ncbi:enoyl-CoA hydratase/isomerase family protein [Microbulbifer epialgicus]|uniref:Enoyl-CoA hydratase/isomerase family protein n=1 Tax=Microbulbifer epialgicus TaxID=393907 RepID=A0ABV4NZT9_9GAMM
MEYQGYTTFNTVKDDGVLTITFDYPPVNIQGLLMMGDLNMLAQKFERDREIKVVVFQSAKPDIFIAHADTSSLKDMSSEAAFHEEAQLLYLQTTLERISALAHATIAKVEGFARDGGHEFSLACHSRRSVTKKREGKNTLRSGPNEAWMPITSLQGCIHSASRVQCILFFRPSST